MIVCLKSCEAVQLYDPFILVRMLVSVLFVSACLTEIAFSESQLPDFPVSPVDAVTFHELRSDPREIFPAVGLEGGVHISAKENSSTPLASSLNETSALKGSGDAGTMMQSSRMWFLRPEDERIDLALLRWSREAGFGYRWDADRFFPIAAATAFEGTYEEAIRQLLASPGILNSAYPLEACIYGNKPPLLRVTRLGDQSQECR